LRIENKKKRYYKWFMDQQGLSPLLKLFFTGWNGPTPKVLSHELDWTFDDINGRI
jgi:hypothetical protein